MQQLAFNNKQSTFDSKINYTNRCWLLLSHDRNQLYHGWAGGEMFWTGSLPGRQVVRFCGLEQKYLKPKLN